MSDLSEEDKRLCLKDYIVIKYLLLIKNSFA